MEEKYNILDNLKKSAKPEIPEGFFDNFHSKMSGLIEGETSDIQFQKSSKPEVPKDFFANFSADLMNKIETEETTTQIPERVWPMKLIGFVSAVAACALIFFMIQPDNEVEIAEVTVESEQVEEEQVESYLAFLDEDEIVDFLLENEDIEITDELTDDEEDEYYFLEEDIEELYLEDL